MDTDQKLVTLKPLLDSIGWSESVKLVALPKERNNRVYRMDGKTKKLFLKDYFHDPEDKRDRLGTEYSFLKFAWDEGLKSVPQPLAQDTVNKMGLYEYMEGQPLSVEEIGVAEMNAAFQFFKSLNQ